ncbi:hypothetical protein ROP_01630 [Rhodococcus opacus B4]|uniref:Uncharacterized protein n=1 Tax=Rhodococcus opacus (strain B4) TaxID=632772 RepID=C1ASG1_RHOOB|nr:hypothetical protein ROP_01630 [Rhodococcus opacus B4]
MTHRTACVRQLSGTQRGERRRTRDDILAPASVHSSAAAAGSSRQLNVNVGESVVRLRLHLTGVCCTAGSIGPVGIAWCADDP